MVASRVQEAIEIQSGAVLNESQNPKNDLSDASAPTSLGDIADRLSYSAGSGEVKLGDIVDTLGSRAHFTVIFAIAAIATTPLSGIPGLSATCGILIGLIAIERLLGRESIYVPSHLRKRGVDAAKLDQYVQKFRPVLTWIDRHTSPHWSALFHRPFVFIPLTICILSGFAMPFLEIIPFSASIIATGVLLISLAFVTRDGRLAILSVLPYAGITYLLTRLA